MEAAVMSRNQQASSLQARVSELEADLESTRHEQRTFGSMFAAKEREQQHKTEALQDEVRCFWPTQGDARMTASVVAWGVVSRWTWSQFRQAVQASSSLQAA
jgi:GH35 family endo-1,4-beta-xylanase